MKVCLIRPPQLVTNDSIGNKAAAPLGIAFLGAIAEKNGFDVTLIDAIAQNPLRLEPFLSDVYINGESKQSIVELIPDDVSVIGFSLMFTMNWLYDRSLIQFVKNHFPKAVIIAGGEHITALPEYSIKQAPIDICVVGEGEITFIDLLNCLQNSKPLHSVDGILYQENGVVVSTTARKRQTDISRFPWPAWHLLPVSSYFNYGMVFGVDRGNCLPVMASRGCPYRCTFCSSPNMWGTRYVLRTPVDVADEMEFLRDKYKVQNVDFYDLTAIVKRDWIIELCKELIKRDLNVTWQLPSGTRSETIDEEVASLMYKSGCRNVTYAPESGSTQILKSILKQVKLENLLLSAKHSVKQNLNVKVNIIIGLPNETHLDVLKTLWFLVRCSLIGVHDTSPGLFYPYPGSKLFMDLVNSGKISLQDDSYFMRLIFTDSVGRNYTYNEKMSIYWIRFYQLMIVFVFYGSNYLFRPIRFFKTLRNIVNNNFESRLEMTLADFFKDNKLKSKGITNPA